MCYLLTYIPTDTYCFIKGTLQSIIKQFSSLSIIMISFITAITKDTQINFTRLYIYAAQGSPNFVKVWNGCGRYKCPHDWELNQVPLEHQTSSTPTNQQLPGVWQWLSQKQKPTTLDEDGHRVKLLKEIFLLGKSHDLITHFIKYTPSHRCVVSSGIN